ncbi:MAG: zinc-ribbon domain-containing protein [Gammaproteobacteria bacterium]|nr:zinc-ribbon domain-containing protein [Gammaproteobacteria bacterium]
MSRKTDSGRDPSAKSLREAERIAALDTDVQRLHPSAVPADAAKLSHINTYGTLPKFYIDQPFTCRDCGKREIWQAVDQKWYYEEAGGHIGATAVRCYACRTGKR